MPSAATQAEGDWARGMCPIPLMEAPSRSTNDPRVEIGQHGRLRCRRRHRTEPDLDRCWCQCRSFEWAVLSLGSQAVVPVRPVPWRDPAIPERRA